jgi:hypothetical protein
MEWSGSRESWRPVSRWAALAWLLFYATFLLYAFRANRGYLFIDSANLVVHEGGHLLFGWFGRTLGIWGGTLLQWVVPLLLAGYFFHERQTASFTFCMFFFFENWLYTATYMADARAMALPLVTTGDPDFVEHDWHTIFSSLGVLQYDTMIAGVVRVCGWTGMLACVVWLTARAWQQRAVIPPLLTSPGSLADLHRIRVGPRCDTPAVAEGLSRELATTLPEQPARRSRDRQPL